MSLLSFTTCASSQGNFWLVNDEKIIDPRVSWIPKMNNYLVVIKNYYYNVQYWRKH